MDAKPIYLTYRILIIGSKAELRKNKNVGEKVGILIFISLFERHHPLPEREKDYYIISFITGFLLLKNDQKI